LMHEAKSWQAKIAIIPHCYMKIKPWLTGINCLYLFFFHRVEESFFLRKGRKKGDFWHIQVWSQILTGKTRNTTTQLYENQTLAHRHQLEVSMSLI
jgi:hypothetical protein